MIKTCKKHNLKRKQCLPTNIYIFSTHVLIKFVRKSLLSKCEKIDENWIASFCKLYKIELIQTLKIKMMEGITANNFSNNYYIIYSIHCNNSAGVMYNQLKNINTKFVHKSWIPININLA